MHDELRELLARKANEMPRHEGVPASLSRRARRRIARNAFAVGTAALVIVVGGFTAVQALTSSDEPNPIPPAGNSSPTETTSPSPTPKASSSPTATPAAEHACTNGQLRAVGS